MLPQGLQYSIGILKFSFCEFNLTNIKKFPNDMKKHVQKCRYRLVECQFCDKRVAHHLLKKNHYQVECLLCGKKKPTCGNAEHDCEYFKEKPSTPLIENEKICNFCNKTFPVDFIFEHKSICSKNNPRISEKRDLNRKSISFHVSRTQNMERPKIDLINADRRLQLNFQKEKSSDEEEEDEEKKRKQKKEFTRSISVRFQRNNFINARQDNWKSSSPKKFQQFKIMGRKSKPNNDAINQPNNRILIENNNQAVSPIDFHCSHCKELIVGVERVDHFLVCEAFPHPCIYCLYKYPRNLISEHMELCIKNQKDDRDDEQNDNSFFSKFKSFFSK